MTTNYRLGIDAGGTFTDFVIADKTTGVTKLFKTLSTPSDPTKAIESGLKLVSEDLGLSPEDVVSNCDLCINGTTVGLNALITHRGGKTGLICTAGHEDFIEIRNGHKEDGFRYDPEYPAAIMLVPRYLRKGVRERVLSDGSIRTPLHEEDVRAACKAFKEEVVETVAISFVWSVLNPEHERRAAEIVREMLPDVILTVGGDLYPQVREYTRTSTSVAQRLPRAGHAQLCWGHRCVFQSPWREATGSLFPVERRSGCWFGHERPLRLRDQFRPGIGAAGGPICLCTVQQKECDHHRYGRHVF